jgi:hypothetical protein
VGEFNTPLSPIDHLDKKKINKRPSGLSEVIDQMDLTDIYRVFHAAATQYTFYLAAH